VSQVTVIDVEFTSDMDIAPGTAASVDVEAICRVGLLEPVAFIAAAKIVQLAFGDMPVIDRVFARPLEELLVSKLLVLMENTVPAGFVLKPRLTVIEAANI